MKANLMFPDRDLDLKAEPCFGKEFLISDLELERMIKSMAGKDEIIRAASSAALFSPLLPAPSSF